jgi:hypothetical protein
MLLSADPQMNNLGLLGITVLMFFAMMTHVKVKSAPRKALPSISLFLLCLFLLFV